MYLKIILIIFAARAQSEIIIDDEKIESLCKKNTCLNKCCRKDEYVSDIVLGEPPICVKYDGEKKLDFSDVQLYDDDDHWRPVTKKFGDTFLLKQGLLLNETFADNCGVAELVDLNSYLSQSGILYLEFPNNYKRWTPIQSEFCLDYANGTIVFWTIFPSSIQYRHVYITNALITSSFFLALLLIVYAILPELRNIGGMVLMAYVFSLMVAFLGMATIQIDEFENDTCVNLTIVIYFFFLAAFAWMNVMSFDIWWTFRGYAKARPIHRRGENFKFCMYCIYAWGVPLAMTLAFMKVNEADLSDQPWIVKPLVPENGCFLQDGQKLVYLYFPMLIMISGNWVFFGMTTFNVWRLRRGTQVLNSPAAGNPAAHRSQKRRFKICVRLSVTMGVSWIWEVISFLVPAADEFALYLDLYNGCIGFLIFLIFVCNRRKLAHLKARFQSWRQPKSFNQNTSNDSQAVAMKRLDNSLSTVEF